MTENPEFLSSQIITYLGNKRTLIGYIQNEIEIIREKTGKKKLVCADLFSGSGIVARMMKQNSSSVIANDLEEYSKILNSCYLSNKKDFDEQKYHHYIEKIERHAKKQKIEGIICNNYAPKNTKNIQQGERVFYTRENAIKIDTYRTLIDAIVDDVEFRKFFIAPLLTECSVHVNTSGIFKGFYKDKSTGIGCFGGTAKNALSRIMGNVELKKPVLSNFKSNFKIFQKDTVELCSELNNLDVAYFDPPYNQHPYGSNYFMLNLIAQNKMPDAKISKVSGIPGNWNRSNFNKKKLTLGSMEKIMDSVDSKFVIVSYNSEGFIKFDEMLLMMQKYGNVKTVEINYNTFRGSRNLNKRNIHVSEFLFVLEKK